MPKLEQFEIKKYWQIFSGLKPVENKVTHDQVLPILYNSKQDSSVLNKIWFLADIDDDDNLDFEEFVICMRLIFDMVNKNISSVPDELPDWLVPGSKAKLVKERKKLKQEENADIPKKEAPKVDWYMSPEDMKEYNSILESCNRSTDGTVTFPSLTLVLKSKFFNIGSSDYDKTWKLVNPKNLASIDKDPALYFIHILRQCNDVGSEIPSDLPRALAEIVNKQEIQYDLKSSQADVKRKTEPSPSSNDTNNTPVNKQSQATQSSFEHSQQPINPNTQTTTTLDIGNVTPEKARLLRQQFEGLLNYRKKQAIASKNPSNSITNSVNLRSITNDLDNIEQQVSILQNVLSDKKRELSLLEQEIQSMK
ncbi:similar to Saccharomyces cerevisiae YNL084C END3 EH domain-containing protein involved in endocytosis, actin cytoskeletal organization and cell wall morphogenesis [Maudiozyma saulgeensis]|uniref:Actin cytoskeleton-regulatory complex protein END3 n=1 Tax=Maudiozyma saulgeensis TaxID=1789683 RepID=A0A1X7QYZ0_9SACH|nr:similar to Saccharomyces cerevisiae YNL084C END3 EH domain-containing protein involved in endocytosis, actin cytoskeletal organization and cell wall morphogenesis [Kazachstania saulgeensis]